MEPTPDFNPKTATKKLLREGRSGALATLMPGSGDPYCSLVNVATAADGAPLLLISRLAVHTKNILADPRVSLMIDERKEGDPLQGGRIMLMGTAAVTQDPNDRRRYLDRVALIREHVPDCVRQFREFGLGYGECRREIDHRPERPDKNTFCHKALPQDVKILDAVQFDHADGAFDTDVLDARQLAARFETRRQRA